MYGGLRLIGGMRSVLPSSPRSICRPLVRTLSNVESSAQDSASRPMNSRPRSHGRNGHENGKLSDRELFLNVLTASTTKRDAKAYISRFGQKGASRTEAEANTLHVALVILRSPQTIEDPVLDGVSRTLSQLRRLGLHIIVVIDPEDPQTPASSPLSISLGVQQCDRIVAALQAHGGTKARRLDSVLGVEHKYRSTSDPSARHARVLVQLCDILKRTLDHGTIPVMPPVAYSVEDQHQELVDADSILPALVKQLLNLPSRIDGHESGANGSESNQPSGRRSCSVDRLIIIDAAGGLPSSSRADRAHVFVNLEQEHREIKEELLQNTRAAVNDTTLHRVDPHGTSKSTGLRPNKPLSRFNEEEVVSDEASHQAQTAKPSKPAPYDRRHARNLDLAQRCLSLLPPSSSALLTTPEDAATLPQSESSASADLGVVTRRPKNPLIFNLLTDKPTISSSLPVARSRLITNALHNTPAPNRATFFKRGMPVTMIPDPRLQPWTPPTPTHPCISLSDPRLDFSRLLSLIEDSFSRPLDVQDYVSRISSRIAGVIIAGAYEGGAVLTWELPPGVSDDGSEESRRRMVPYLDKFAVRKRSQGSGGVADVVFSAMVRTCFPSGVCWRSRKDNPVNKWYFERSVGTWKLLGSDWSMFWTTEGLFEGDGVGGQRWRDYEGVCRGVRASWADGRSVVD